MKESQTVPETETRAPLGVLLQSEHIDGQQVLTLVGSVTPGGLFETTGIQAGDRIISVNGVPVTSAPHAQLLLTEAVGTVRLVATSNSGSGVVTRSFSKTLRV